MSRTKVILEVSEAISLTVERYNELIQAEPYKRRTEAGFVDIELVSYENSVRLSVSPTATLKQVAIAGANLIPVPRFGQGLLTIHSSEGVLLELNRPLSEYHFKYGERLFLGTKAEAEHVLAETEATK